MLPLERQQFSQTKPGERNRCEQNFELSGTALMIVRTCAADQTGFSQRVNDGLCLLRTGDFTIKSFSTASVKTLPNITTILRTVLSERPASVLIRRNSSICIGEIRPIAAFREPADVDLEDVLVAEFR
jgi:hypothetical protein